MTARDGPSGREVLFEFRHIAGQIRVAAIDAATGTEVIIIAPAGSSRTEMQRVATAKLRRRMATTSGRDDGLESPDLV